MSKQQVRERVRERGRGEGLFGQAVVDAGDLPSVPIIAIVTLALRLVRPHLADYAHVNAPKKFTQLQLFACLILKAHMGCTYRKCEELLILMPGVREAIGLDRVPRFTTLQTFADKPEIFALIDAVLASIGRELATQQPQEAALDGTGLEVTIASAGWHMVWHRLAVLRLPVAFEAERAIVVHACRADGLFKACSAHPPRSVHPCSPPQFLFCILTTSNHSSIAVRSPRFATPRVSRGVVAFGGRSQARPGCCWMLLGVPE